MHGKNLNLVNQCKKFLAAIVARLFFFLPDDLYLRIRFRLLMGEKLNLKNPKTFNEKINWLKIYDRNPLYHTLVDKAMVKDWVASKIGCEHIIPTLGVWDCFDEIEFDKLPNQFVLKTTNGGGGDGVYICHDKIKMNRQTVKKMLHKFCNGSWKIQREWVYSGVKTRYIAEKLMKSENGDLKDYKFFCFNGEPKFCQVIRDRFANETVDIFDLEWNLLSFVGLSLGVKNGIMPVDKPHKLKEMISICKLLSNGFYFIRVDLYDVNDVIYFGEMTFYPLGGFGSFDPVEWNYKIGEMLKLPELTDSSK